MRSRVLAGALLLLGLLASSQAALLAVDLGSEFLKVSLVKPGRTPIAVVINEMSKRRSPALSGVVWDERIVGEEAFSLGVRYPEAIIARAHDLLGKTADDPSIAAMLKAHALPFKVEAHPTRGTAAVNIGGKLYSAEELVANLLEYAQQLAVAQAGSPVVDAVIAVPAFYSQAQRRALLDAAALAGLNVLGLVNAHSAAALAYGIERDFVNKTQHVVFYDVGAHSTQAALVRYSHYNAREGLRTVSYSQFEVLGAEWDAALGSNDLDMALLNHYSQQFSEKHGLPQDVRTFPKAVAKIRKQVRRTKEMLSANSGAPLSVEEFHDGHDFATYVSREDFEALAALVFKAAAAPLARLLANAGLAAKDVDAVELLGGGSRVPGLQAALSEALGGRSLDRHLDADEAVVMGAGLFAANLSTSFRLRKFGMADGAMFGISYLPDGAAGAGDEAPKPINLLPYLKRVPAKRVIHLHNLTDDALAFRLAYNDSTPHGLPPGATKADISAYKVTGVADVISKYNTSGKVSLRFEVDSNGLLVLDRAEAAVEVEVMEEVIEPAVNATASATPAAAAAAVDGKEADASASSSDASPTAGDAAAAPSGAAAATAANATEPRKILVPRRKLFKPQLKIESAAHTPPPMSQADRDAAAAMVATWRSREAVKRANAKARNDLEAYVINTREALEENEALRQVTTEAQRESFGAQLTEVEDWLYGDGDDLPAADYIKKLAELTAVGGPMTQRAAELQARPAAVEKATAALAAMREALQGWPETKPWINETEREEVANKLSEVQSWLDAQLEAQDKKADTDAPAFLAKDVLAKLEPLRRSFDKVNNKKKPKPPPAAANGGANGGAGAGGEGAAADGSAEGGSAGEGAAGGQQDGQQQQQEEGGGGAGSEQPAGQEEGDSGAEAPEELPVHEEL